MRLARALPAAKIPAPSCKSYFLTAPKSLSVASAPSCSNPIPDSAFSLQLLAFSLQLFPRPSSFPSRPSVPIHNAALCRAPLRRAPLRSPLPPGGTSPRHAPVAAGRGGRPALALWVVRICKCLMLKTLQQSPKSCISSLTKSAYVLNLRQYGKVRMVGWQWDEDPGMPGLFRSFAFPGSAPPLQHSIAASASARHPHNRSKVQFHNKG